MRSSRSAALICLMKATDGIFDSVAVSTCSLGWPKRSDGNYDLMDARDYDCGAYYTASLSTSRPRGILIVRFNITKGREGERVS